MNGSCDARSPRGAQAGLHRARTSAVLFVMAALAVAKTAAADSPEAARVVKAAERLLATGKVAEACGLFGVAGRLDPSPRTQLALARCEERAGRLATALEAYRAIARGPNGSATLAAAAAARVLEPKVPRVVVVVDRATPEEQVLVDGKPASVHDASPVLVNPGAVVVAASAPGKKPWQTTVTASKGTLRGEVVTVRIPPLEDDVSRLAAQETGLTPLGSLSGATWSDSVGFVVAVDAPPPAAPRRAEMSLPVATDDNLSRITWETPIALGAVKFQARGHSDWGVRTGLLLRSELRDRTSHVAPWFDVGVAGGYLPGQKLGFFGGGVHVGVDVHPGRLTSIGVGPFVGYQLLGIFGVSGGKALAHGPDIGIINVHFRLKEEDGKVPDFDVDVYALERISMGSVAAATYLGLRAAVGSSTRLQIFVEGRPLPLDSSAGGLLAPQFFAGLGLGHEK